MSNSSIYIDKKKIFETDVNPKLVVFDLDFTVWPFDLNHHILAPFTIYGYNVFDLYGSIANPYPDVPYIFKALIDSKIPVAIASRNPGTDNCRTLLQSIKIPDSTLTLWDAVPNENLFHAYSSGNYGCGNGKKKHFTNIQNFCNIDFSDMLFFDDNLENIEVAQQQNITSILVNKFSGLNWQTIEYALDIWRTNKGIHESTIYDKLLITPESNSVIESLTA